MQTLSNNQLPCSSPEEQGVSSAAVLAFVQALDQEVDEVHSFMLLRNGAVIAEGWWNPYGPQYPHVLFSLSKSFTASAIGLLAGEGRISLNDPVISFFPDDLPEEVSDNLARMRIKQLLSMSTGHNDDSTERMIVNGGDNWVKGFLALVVEHKPGTHFVYNTGATYMLSAILQKVTGQTLMQYLTPRLFEPLGIKGAAWESCPRGINVGGFGLSVKTEDIARFGQLYLQKGMWNGQRILPEGWVEEASARQVSNGSTPESDWEQGYGYQFWRCRHNAYRGDGAFGQYCVVMPEHNAVLAITSGLSNMQQVLDIAWDNLLPAFEAARLPDNQEDYAKLRQKLDNLAILPPQGAPAAEIEGLISGKCYEIEENEFGIKSITFDFTQNEIFYTAKHKLGESQLLFDRGSIWRGSKSDMFSDSARREVASVANNAVWQDANTLLITSRLYETPFYFTQKCIFEDEKIIIDTKINVNFGPTEMQVLTGKAA
jgi:CubicO group peptidase (beta-lactamase class C family)